MGKERLSISISPEMFDVVNEIGGKTTDDDKINFSAVLESIVENFLRQGLKGKVFAPTLAGLKTPEEVMRFWLNIRRAERKEKGYKIHSHPKGGIIAVTGPKDAVSDKD